MERLTNSSAAQGGGMQVMQSLYNKSGFEINFEFNWRPVEWGENGGNTGSFSHREKPRCWDLDELIGE